MKKQLSILLIILLLTVTTNAQSKKDTSLKQDTVITGYNTAIILDSIQYSNLKIFLGSLPVNNPYSEYLYNLVNGNNKNIGVYPVYGIAPKKQK